MMLLLLLWACAPAGALARRGAPRERGALPALLQCWATPRFWRAARRDGWADSPGVWRRLGRRPGLRADATCCSTDKVDTVLHYRPWPVANRLRSHVRTMLDNKARSLDDQKGFTAAVANTVSRMESQGWSCREVVGGALQARVAAHQRSSELAREGFGLARRVAALTLRLHCLLPRRQQTLASTERALRLSVRRLAALLLRLGGEARSLAALDLRLVSQDANACLPAPLLALTAGVMAPAATLEETVYALGYPFVRASGSVHAWNGWVDRAALALSRLPAKLAHQMKMITSSFEPMAREGPASGTFWDHRLLTEPREPWRWPNHWDAAPALPADEAGACGASQGRSCDDTALVLLVSNRTCEVEVERAWASAEQLLNTTDGTQVLWLEDSIRDPWVTAERPVHAARLARRVRRAQGTAEGSRPGAPRAAVVWRRHQNTLDNRRVACLHLGGGVGGRGALVGDLRGDAGGSPACSAGALAGSSGVAAGALWSLHHSVAHPLSPPALSAGMTRVDAAAAQAEGAQQGRAAAASGATWATAGLQRYLAWHRRAVRAWRDGGPEMPRALVYVCNPLELCGGHGDRTNGILTAFLLAVLTSRAFFIDLDSPVPLGTALQPRRGEDGEFLLDWRLQGGAVGVASHNFYLDDRVGFQVDVSWLVRDASSTLLLSMNHREAGALLGHPLLRRRAQELGLRQRPDLYARLWATLFEPAPPLRARLRAAQQELQLDEPLPWDSAAGSPAAGGYLGIHFRAGNESARLWWDPGRHALSSLDVFLDCARIAERELGLPAETKWFLSADTEAALRTDRVEQLRRDGKVVVLLDGWRIAHVDRSNAHLALHGFMDSYAAYFLLASARAVVLSFSS
ncbi:unnamed protein product [Prorocentrum cordatum]|uniref:Peptide-O-fucosyltransferase n=1 Tax=Prorocentrum cordatum TaxID=2364126 RepID=A0ABN9T637_9DINO|nr:unnamed protein product [Polarella glacialis]